MTYRQADDFSADVLREYQNVIFELAGDDGMTKQDAFRVAEDRIAELVIAGEVRIDIRAAIRNELQLADAGQGKLADKLIHTLATGQGSLDMDDDPATKIVVVLGKGMRKSWGMIDEVDLRQMDANRYENFRRAVDSYDRWRQDFDVVLPVLVRYKTIGAALAAGAFDFDAAGARS